MKKYLVVVIFLPGLALFLFLIMMRPDTPSVITPAEEGCLVLAYHRVVTAKPVLRFLSTSRIRFPGDEELRYYTVFSDEFADQISYMLERGAYFITPGELEDYIFHRSDLPPKSVLITFDDVDVSVFENAYPFLLEKEIPFILFVITRHMGSPDFKGLQLCSWEQIEKMMHSGLASVGAHSHDFHYLDKDNNPPFLNPKNNPAFVADSELAVLTIEEKLGLTPRYYSYPYGFGTPDTDYILMDAGFRLIFSLAPGTVLPGDPCFFVNRVLVTRQSWPAIAEWFER